jgi:hypothetical protein
MSFGPGEVAVLTVLLLVLAVVAFVLLLRAVSGRR